MAKKPERLTTEDDLKILNSFMSSDRDNSKERNYDNSNDQSLPMKVIGIGSTVSSDYKHDKQLSSKKKEFLKTQNKLPMNRKVIRGPAFPHNQPASLLAAGGNYLATTELHFESKGISAAQILTNTIHKNALIGRSKQKQNKALNA